MHVKIALRSSLPKLGVLTNKLGKRNFGQFVRGGVHGGTRGTLKAITAKLTRLRGMGIKLMRRSTGRWFEWWRTGVRRTLDREVGDGRDRPKPRLPVMIVDAVPIGAEDAAAATGFGGIPEPAA